MPVLVVLSLAAPFTLLTHFGAMLCEATATLNVKIVISLSRVGWLALFLLLLDGYGVVGIATAFAISEFLTNLVYLPVMRRLLTVSIGAILRSHSIGLVAGAITGVTLYGLHVGLTQVGLRAPAILAAQVAVGILFLLVTVVRPRGGLVWREIRPRLDAAGYGREHGRGGAVLQDAGRAGCSQAVKGRPSVTADGRRGRPRPTTRLPAFGVKSAFRP